jgi:hypothetical protein
MCVIDRLDEGYIFVILDLARLHCYALQLEKLLFWNISLKD